ncbi:amidohydrolase family protein [Nocardiopsis dassonvillei]|uniref:amidohydrolase family protein n=1 Tax=Nocardiopsis dassonvillei TaxID=2014 RepID=UPI003F5558C0
MSTPATVIISGARVFDGEAFHPRADVAFAGDTVLGVGRDLAAAHPQAHTVDATGKTVVPGIIDLHVHMTTQQAGSLNAFAEPFSLQFYNSAAHLKRTLEAGVTTVRDAGGTDLGAKVAVESGVIPGPRLRIAVTIMSQTGGHGDPRLPSGPTAQCWRRTPGAPPGSPTVSRRCAGPCARSCARVRTRSRSAPRAASSPPPTTRGTPSSPRTRSA